MNNDLEKAIDALRGGELVVYPTETVYGLGADALNESAVEQVFSAKRRECGNPVSMAVPGIEAARKYTNPTERELAFMREFLPGPVTVVLERKDVVPDVLTAGRDGVGIRIPAHKLALSMLEQYHPVTATSANISGEGSVCRVDQLDTPIRDAVSVVLDGGETPGGGSTVIDLTHGEILRRGQRLEAVESWLVEN